MPLKDVDARRAYRQAQYLERKSTGLCVDCGKPRNGPPEGSRPVGGPSLRCLDCAERKRGVFNRSAKKRRALFAEDGLCRACGAKPRHGLTLCQRCTDRCKRQRDATRPARLMAHKAAHQALKRLAFEKYGGCYCLCCGEKHMEFLSIDHIGGTGAAHRREIGFNMHGNGLYRWLKARKFPKGYRVLCMNCNFSFGHAGYCPHGTLVR
jgi:hypothetical protein